MTVSAISAAVSSFSGLRALAQATGWGDWLSPLLPLTVDAYAATATLIWLTSPGSARGARRFARWNAIGAVLLSITGNAVWHLIAAHLLVVTWLTVVVVGAVPAAVLGLLSHLAVLRTHQPLPAAVPVPEPPDSVPELSTADAVAKNTPFHKDTAVLDAARAADAAYRQAHQGRPITRDALRQELRVSAERASAVLRRLRDESARST